MFNDSITNSYVPILAFFISANSFWHILAPSASLSTATDNSALKLAAEKENIRKDKTSVNEKKQFSVFNIQNKNSFRKLISSPVEDTPRQFSFVVISDTHICKIHAKHVSTWELIQSNLILFKISSQY